VRRQVPVVAQTVSRLAENVWLSRAERWHVIVREGDAETGAVLRWDCADEPAARALVDRLICARDPAPWRRMGGLNRTPAPSGR
jgi:hypothetical protein